MFNRFTVRIRQLRSYPVAASLTTATAAVAPPLTVDTSQSTSGTVVVPAAFREWMALAVSSRRGHAHDMTPEQPQAPGVDSGLEFLAVVIVAVGGGVLAAFLKDPTS
jgi:hypothetical protein